MFAAVWTPIKCKSNANMVYIYTTIVW